MAAVYRTVHIAAPPGRVFPLVSDPARIAGLDPRVGGVRVERDDAGPRRVYLEAAPGEGQASATIVADVVRWVPGREFVLASSDGAPGPAFRLAVSCREAGGGTDLTCEVEIRLPGIAGRMADPVVGAALTRQVAALLAAVEREAVAPPRVRPGPLGFRVTPRLDGIGSFRDHIQED
ncbi:MAG TPA: SRPBCC family protein [bacterium]|nr:SRPBCC family protein [bacterium]